MITLLLLAAVSLTPNQTRAIEQEVKTLLRDPQSAQFRNIKANDKHVFCGEVNSKNGFGGYGGFTKFLGFFKENGKPVVSPIMGDTAHTVCEGAGL
jgi:hypothetical protein